MNVVIEAQETAAGRDASIDSNRCQDPIFAREVFELSNEYLESFYAKSLKGFDPKHMPAFAVPFYQRGFIKTFWGSDNLNGDRFEIPLFNGCPEKYTIALSAIAILYSENKPKEAQKYYTQFITGNFASDKLKLIDLFLEYAGLNGTYWKKEGDTSKKPTKIPFIMTGVDGNFAIFKKSVDNDLICEASSLLFNELKDSKYTVTARSYLNSKNKLSKKKVKCGDEDLELLLK